MIKKLMRTLSSVLSAMIGVQSHKNLTHDFEEVERSGPFMFIIVGVVTTVLFILTLVVVVNLVLT